MLEDERANQEWRASQHLVGKSKKLEERQRRVEGVW